MLIFRHRKVVKQRPELQLLTKDAEPTNSSTSFFRLGTLLL